MSATIRDISRETGLSLATISKYLNGGNVLPENREKIEVAIEKLHYEVNQIARSLVTKKTNTIGVVVCSIKCSFNGTFLHYANHVLSEKGYGLLICDSGNDEKKELQNIKFLLNKKVDGIIIIPVSTKSDFLQLVRQEKVPIVLVDRKVEDSFVDCVKVDNEKAALNAVNLLIKYQHKKIAVIYGAKESTGMERYKGYRKALKEAGISNPISYQKKGKHSVEFGYESMKQLLRLKNPPTAVFMTNYELTLGAIMAVNESQNISCPKDISMIGFDDLILTDIAQPKMCVVIQPMKELSESAVDLLLKRIDGNQEKPLEINLNACLKRGNSIRMCM